MIPQSTETPEPQRQIEVVRCHCKSIIAGQVLPVGDEASIAEWEADKKRYARRGYSIAIVPEATMGSCKCKELIASLEAQVKAMREAGEAVVNRWEDPKWEWDKHGHTASLIADLRKSLDTPTHTPDGK